MFPWMSEFGPVLSMVGLAAAAYLVGSVNTSILASRLFGLPDPRSGGSKNPGATNFLRIAGWRLAIPVLAVDMAKASGTIFAARYAGPPDLAPTMALPFLLGNLFPIFHGFKGGKGVAAAVGAFLIISPPAMLIGAGVFGLTLAIFKRVSLGSLAMVSSYPISIWFLGGAGYALATAAMIALIIYVTHRANIARLVQGKEPQIGERKGASE